MNLALFDFDGTISVGDTYTPFLRFATEPGRIALGSVVLAPVMVGYKLGLISPSTARVRASSFAFRGRREADVRQVGAHYAHDVLPGVIRPEALARIAWHQAEGDRVVVVSGSLNVYLSEWCRRQRLDLICTELEAKDGTLTGRYRQGDCVGAEKARRVMAAYSLREYPVIYAYGDTADDLDMLRLAHRRFFRWQEMKD